MRRTDTSLERCRSSLPGLRTLVVLVAVLAFLPVTASALITVGSIDTRGPAQQVEVVDGLAYLADGFSGLRIIDVSNPAAPLEVGHIDTPGRAEDVAVVGGAYVAADADAPASGRPRR